MLRQLSQPLSTSPATCGRKTRLTAKPAKEDSKWSYGIRGACVYEALAGWQAVELPGEYYQMQNSKGDDIYAILRAFGMELKAQLYTRGEIRELKAAASPFKNVVTKLL